MEKRARLSLYLTDDKLRRQIKVAAAKRGLSISDYNTSDYKNMIGSDWAAINGSQISGGVLPTSGVSTTTEYFPHAAGSYNTPKSSSSLTLNRKTYENRLTV